MFDHQFRYAKAKRAPEVTVVEVWSDDEVLCRGARWNLRSRSKVGRCNGFLPGPNGALLRYQDSKLLSCWPGVGEVELAPMLDVTQLYRAGRRIVGGRDARAPFVVVDAQTGTQEGALLEQRPVVLNGFSAFKYPRAQIDGDVLWINEVSRFAAYDLSRCALVAAVEPPDQARFVGAARLSSGAIAAIVRPADQYARMDRSADRVACFDPSGAERWSVELAPMHIAAVGSHFVCVDDARARFIVLDQDGAQAQSIAMFEPSKIPWATVVPLPTGREWIAIGGHGEWDHYAEG